MIGRVKVTTSIERNVSLYTTPDKNTSNGKHAAFPKFTKEEIGANYWFRQSMHQCIDCLNQ